MPSSYRQKKETTVTHNCAEYSFLAEITTSNGLNAVCQWESVMHIISDGRTTPNISVLMCRQRCSLMSEYLQVSKRHVWCSDFCCVSVQTTNRHVPSFIHTTTSGHTSEKQTAYHTPDCMNCINLLSLQNHDRTLVIRIMLCRVHLCRCKIQQSISKSKCAQWAAVL